MAEASLKEKEVEVEESQVSSSSRLKASSFKMKKRAHNKALMHATQFPWADVLGFLLGTVSGSEVIITDAIPLFHTVLFTPMLDIATRMVKLHCESDSTPKGTTVVGVYFGSSRNNYAGTYPKIKKVAEQLEQKFNVPTCLAIIDNADIAEETNQGFNLFAGDGWKPVKTFTVEDIRATNANLTSLLKNENNFCDFESWLEDTSLDWRNLNIGA